MVKFPSVTSIFDDLDDYRKFCVEFGYVYNEADLYRRNTPYGLFEKHQRGESVKSWWIADAAYIAESGFVGILKRQ